MLGGLAFAGQVSVKGEQILLGGEPVKILGLRCSNALISDETTDALIGELDFYKNHGLKEKGCYNYSRIGRYTAEMKADQFKLTREEVEKFNGFMLASTWLQCGVAEGVGGPFAKAGGRSDLGSKDDPKSAWNRDID